jgi:tRNA(fMet)-specific endonuclease VapC
MNAILPDTNAYSRYCRGDEFVLEALTLAERVYLSIFVVGELVTGFKGGDREAKNMAVLEEFLTIPTVEFLGAGWKTAQIFGDLKSYLKKMGTPLPVNDVWIASHCLETDSQILTFDVHFQKIPAIRLVGDAFPSPKGS